MTFQEHEPFGNKPLLRITAALGAVVISTAVLTGASSEARAYGDAVCQGVTEYPVNSGDSVQEIIEAIAEKLHTNATDYSRIFYSDNPIIFAYDTVADQPVIAENTREVKIPTECN